MPITRRALLISNPGETGAENYCKGVYVDVRNYQRFLNTSEGGAWEANEIEVMDRPNKVAVKLKIAEFARYDYTVIMFTGHGWYSSADEDRVLHLRQGEEIASDDLLLYAKRRLLILDCCQVVHHESLQEKASLITCFSNEARSLRTSNRLACRDLYLKEVEKAPLGSVRISSCAINERSWDDDSTGGRYNSSIIRCGEKWVEVEAQKPWGSAGVMSVVVAHEAAAEVTRRRSNGVQNPAIEKAKSGPYFPFAVFA